jgi:flagellar biosynthesis chaperone FliJ
MKKPEYPLQQLEVIKKKKLEESERILKEKKEALAKEEEKLAAVQKERDKVYEHRMAKLKQLREKLDEGTTTDKIQQMKQYLKVVDEDLRMKDKKVADQKKQVENAQNLVEAARLDMLKKQQDVEKLQIHRKEWSKEVRKEMERVEGNELDELGSAMHTLKKRKKK